MDTPRKQARQRLKRKTPWSQGSLGARQMRACDWLAPEQTRSARYQARRMGQDLHWLVLRPDKEFVLFAFAVGILGRVEGNAANLVGCVAVQFRRTPKLLGVEACVDTRRFADDIVEDFLGDGAEELMADDRLTSSRSQDPGVEVDVCLPAPTGKWICRLCLTAIRLDPPGFRTWASCPARIPN